MTDVGSQGIRGRRKSAYSAGAVVLLVVAVMLAGGSVATGTPPMLWLAVGLAVAALALLLAGKRARRSPPSHADHPRLTHGEDHPKDDPP